jgi:ElaB/YqjD/DUF883 family membrane-anchored ribosome-binding protein
MAVLAGDFLLGRASVALARLRDPEVTELLATVIANLVEGEFMQLKNTALDEKKPVWSEETITYYLQKTYLKSASLISKSCRAAALLGEHPAEVVEAAYQYGKNLGLAFQLVDDMLDYTVSGQELGKPAGADLELGLATAPLLFAWRDNTELGVLVGRKFSQEGDVAKVSAVESRGQQIRQMRADFEARLTKVRERENKIKERNANANGEPPIKRQKRSHGAIEQDEQDDDQFVLDDYNSDDEHVAVKQQEYPPEVAKLMEKMGLLPKSDQERAHDDEVDELKIYFCSRTHSQLSQFTGELKRVRLPPGLPPEKDGEVAEEEIKQLTLGSRSNLCINPKVNKLSTSTAINEKCIELQQSSTPAAKKCSFLPNKDSESIVLDFRDHALSKLRDIEDLAKLGSKLQICPYYASRPAIGNAEIVTLPYPLLLQRAAREALGYNLKNHVVIIDEAHNLISSIEGTYSSQISDTQLQKAKSGLMTYLQKFRNRLKGSNRSYVTQVVRVMDSLLKFTNSVKDLTSTGDAVDPSALLAGKSVDQINLTKLVQYITESKLARKVESYAAYAARPIDNKPLEAQRFTAKIIRIA